MKERFTFESSFSEIVNKKNSSEIPLNLDHLVEKLLPALVNAIVKELKNCDPPSQSQTRMKVPVLKSPVKNGQVSANMRVNNKKTSDLSNNNSDDYFCESELDEDLDISDKRKIISKNKTRPSFSTETRHDDFDIEFPSSSGLKFTTLNTPSSQSKKSHKTSKNKNIKI